MTQNNYDVGPRHDPTIENCATIYNYDTQVYITDASDDLHQLKNEPVIRDFANVTPDTYELIKATNPYLLMFVDLAKRIMEAEG